MDSITATTKRVVGCILPIGVLWGCSGVNRAFIHNRLDHSIAVEISSQEERGIRTRRIDVPAMDSKQVNVWSRPSPDSFNVKVFSRDRSLIRATSFAEDKYLVSMRNRYSMGEAFRIVVESNQIRLEEATWLEKNADSYLNIGGWVICFGGGTWLLIWMLSKVAPKPSEAKVTTRN